jgi:hypothetical protein
VLKNIHVPEDVVNTIVASVEADQNGAEERRREQLAGLKQRLAALRTRMDRMYEDKLDGRIDGEFWSRKMAEWRTQERALESAAQGLSVPVSLDRALSATRILELANRAHFLYLTRNSAEREQLLKSVLLSCATDRVNLWLNYRKPFDLSCSPLTRLAHAR